jgi:ectoine hydroxylase-related dioxygenase (phytanoyl-CoA dioxygenase family)
MIKSLDVTGYYLVKNCFDQRQLRQLLDVTHTLANDNTVYGVRNLLHKAPALKQFVDSPAVRNLVEPILGKTAVPVRAIYFDKNPQANWNVAWHQDTTIAVDKKIDIPGFGPWSEKSGVVHVEPPVEILKNILTMRIHLDKTAEHNGALRVLARSHQYGRIPSSEILNLAENGDIVTCSAEPGDVLLMRPLLLHSSRKSRAPSHRRVIHIEFSSVTLPSPLQWAEI